MDLHHIENDPARPELNCWGEVNETEDGCCEISVNADPGAPGQSITIAPDEAAALARWLTDRFGER